MKKFIFSLLFLFAVAATEGNAQGWIQKAPYDFALQGASGVEINGKMYVVGGVDNSGCHNELREYDPATNTYTAKTPFPGAMRQGGFCFAANGLLFYGGGEGASFGQGPYSDMYMWNPLTDVWTQVADVPAAFAYASAVNVNGQGVVLGGLNSVSCVINDSIRIYNPMTDTWTSIPMPQPMIAMYGSVAAVINGIIYYGSGFSMSGPSGDFWMLDLSTGACAAIAAFPGLPRSGAATFVLGEEFFVIGGTIGCAWYASVFAYDIANGIWNPKDSLVAPLANAVGVSAGGSGYVVGGASNVGVYTSQTQEYNTGVTTDVVVPLRTITVKAYPNPAVGSMMLEVPDDGEYHVTIYDTAGRLVLDTVGRGQIKIELLSGVYACSIESTEGGPAVAPKVLTLVFQ